LAHLPASPIEPNSLEGEDSFFRATKLNDKDGKSFIGLGVAQHGLANNEKAVENIKAGILFEGEQAYSLNWLGNVYSDQRKYELAIASYQQAINLDPKDANPHNGLGGVYQAQGEYKLAIASYQQAINLDPKDVNPHNGFGNVYNAQGEYELAIASYQQAINLDPKYATPHYNLGIVYQAQGEYELAIASYQQAIDLDPKAVYPHGSLGYLYLSQGDLEKAKLEFIEAINLDSEDWVCVMNLGIVSGLQDNQEEAITLWKQGLELLTGNSQHERIFRTLHEVGIGEIERGTNCLREILETEKPPLGILSDVLKDAELIARFPTKLEGIDTVVEMLRQAIEKAQ
jgi:tetratricopeptide (TPR) repeat protein